MKKANFLYISLQIALWGIYAVLYSYANRYLLSAGLTSTEAGIILAISTLTAFFLQPAITAVLDKNKLSLKGVLTILGALMLGCCIALAIFKSALATASIYAVAYVGVVVYPAFVNSIGVVAMKSGYNVNFALARGVGALAFGITAWGTNLCIEHFGVGTLPFLGALFCVLGLASTLVFPTGAESLTKGEKASKATDFFRRNKRFMLTLLCFAVLNIGHNILGNCMYQISVFKGDSNAQGMVLMISTIVEIPTIVFFTKLLKLKGSSVWLKISGVFFTLRILLTLILPGVWGLYTAQLCQIAGYALYTVCSVYYAGEVVNNKDTVKGQTYVTAANTIGCLAAHLFGGVMIDTLGVGNMLLITTAISAAGMLALFICAEKTNKHTS